MSSSVGFDPLPTQLSNLCLNLVFSIITSISNLCLVGATLLSRVCKHNLCKQPLSYR
ncbi:hypothetical protein AHAS_Ahas03G0220100 [Arachis hypogaea]